MYNESSFYSMDRLMEFGMSIAVAQQMVKSMNNTMQSMHIPGVGNPMQKPAQNERVYYAALDGKQAGPFSETEVTRLINEKKITNQTYIWYPGLSAWKTAESIPEIVRLVALAPPAIPSSPPAIPPAQTE